MKVNVKEFIPQRKTEDVQFQRAYQGLIKARPSHPREPAPSEREGVVDEALAELVR